MSNEVKKSKNKQKSSMIEIACMETKVAEAGKLLNNMNKGSILEFALHEAEMSIKLGTHKIDPKTGKRYIDGKEVGKEKVSEKTQEEGR